MLFVLCLQVELVELKTVNFNPEFISRMVAKLDWSVLKTAAETVSQQNSTVCVYG